MVLIRRGLSPDDMLEGSLDRHLYAFRREPSPFPMSVLHYELHQTSPSICVVRALLKQKPNARLQDGRGLIALQVLVQRFISELYRPLTYPSVEGEDFTSNNNRATPDALQTLILSNELALSIFRLLLQSGFVADRHSIRWLCARVDQVQGALGRWARRGQRIADEVNRAKDFTLFLTTIQEMLKAVNEAAKRRSIHVVLCIRKRLPHHINIEGCLASKILCFLTQIES